MRDLGELREDYSKNGLKREDLNADPFQQFDKWFDDAMNAELLEPNAMSLATVSEDGTPSIRTVLLKYYDKDGLVFFTNYESKKAKEIANNNKVGLLFPWIPLQRQVKIQGTATKISRGESLKYFISRPHGSQLGAWVSDQSSVISSRKILDMKLQEMKQKFKKGQVPLPDFWGGYKIKPISFEFWQGRSNRIHDRFLYSKGGDDSLWKINQLAP